MDTQRLSALQHLFSPLQITGFLRDYSASRTFHMHGEITRLPAAVTHKNLRSAASLCQAYRGRILYSEGGNDSRMLPIVHDDPHEHLRCGHTVYFDNLAPWIAGLGEFLAELERELGLNDGSARIGAFASPAGGGAPCHYDVEDVISIQIAGNKRFHLAPVGEIPNPCGCQYAPGTPAFPDLYPQTGNGFPNPDNARFECVDMRPGSVLFMPRGTWHYTAAGEESFALSIILRPPTAADCVLESLRLLLLQDPRWRRPLYGAWGSGEQRDVALCEAERLLAQLPAIVAEINTETLLSPTRSEAQRLAGMDQDSRFQTQPNAGITTTGTAPGSIELRIRVNDDTGVARTTAKLTIAQAAVTVFSWIAAERKPFRVRELEMRFPSFSTNEHLRILNACARGGLVKLLWFPPLAQPNNTCRNN